MFLVYFIKKMIGPYPSEAHGLTDACSTLIVDCVSNVKSFTQSTNHVT